MGNKRPTQVDRVIDYINQFGSITTLSAFKDLGITRLSARIYEVKERGYAVKTEMITGKNRFGEKTHYFKYSFIED